MIYIVYSKEQHLTSLDEQRKMSNCLLQAGLMKEYHLDPGRTGIIKNAWGKPLLKDRPDINFNISHCCGGVALAISTSRTGIDIEKVRSFSMITARKILSDDELSIVLNSRQPEQDFFRFWTLKESYVKAVGAGTLIPLKNVKFSIDQDQGHVMHCSRKGCLFTILEHEAGFVTSVCYLNSRESMKETVEYRLLP